MQLKRSAAASPALVRIALAACLVAVLTVSGGIAWTLSRSVPSATPPLALSLVVPPEITIKGTPALSPDGRAIAFAGADRESSPRIWLRPLDRLDSRAVGGTDGGDQPFWSPDSQSLGFFARGKLWTIAIGNGGSPRALADAPDPRGGTWSREGIIVFSPQSGSGLYRISADGGPAMPLSTLDRQRQEASHRWPRFLPDGRIILFMNRVANDAMTRFIVTAISIDGSGMKPIVEADSTGVYSSGRLLFCRAGNVFAQPFDAIELNLSGESTLVVNGAWQDEAAMAGRAAFDAVDGVLATRPDLRDDVIHLLFDWTAIQPQ